MYHFFFGQAHAWPQTKDKVALEETITLKALGVIIEHSRLLGELILGLHSLRATSLRKHGL